MFYLCSQIKIMYEHMNKSLYLGLGLLMLTACGEPNSNKQPENEVISTTNNDSSSAPISSKEAKVENNSTVQKSNITKMAAKILLDDERAMRIDYQIDENGNVSGWSTYYRKNGTSFTIPFFGNSYLDNFVGTKFFEVHEYHNNKCCGHHVWAINDSDEFDNGHFILGEKTIGYKTFETQPYNEEANATFETPGTNPSLAKSLFPCPIETAKESFKKAYGIVPTHFLLVDIDHSGSFEAFMKGGTEKEVKVAMLWTKGGAPLFISYDDKGGENTWIGANAPNLITRDSKGVKTYQWKNGEPTMTEFIPANKLEETEIYWRIYRDPAELGEWVDFE